MTRFTVRVSKASERAYIIRDFADNFEQSARKPAINNSPERESDTHTHKQRKRKGERNGGGGRGGGGESIGLRYCCRSWPGHRPEEDQRELQRSGADRAERRA